MVHMGCCKIFLDIQDRYSFIENKLQVRLETICRIKQIWMSVLWHNLTKGGAKIFDKFEVGDQHSMGVMKILVPSNISIPPLP